MFVQKNANYSISDFHENHFKIWSDETISMQNLTCCQTFDSKSDFQPYFEISSTKMFNLTGKM